MLIIENIRISLNSLMNNKMRSFLTMLGIIIGIGSVIAIMTVSSSLTSSITSSFDEMGAKNITVGVKQADSDSEVSKNGLVFGGGNKRTTMEESDLISDDMISEMKEVFSDSIDGVSISESVGSGTVEKGSEYANISITGINKDYFLSSDVTLLAGRRITQEDIEGNKSVIMVSDKFVENIFAGNNDDALWQKVSVNVDGEYCNYYIVGIYEYETDGQFSSSSDSDVTTSAYIPITTAKEQTHADDGYSQFTVISSSTVSDVSTLASSIESFFARYYTNNDDYEISTTTMESISETMNEMIDTVSIAIAFIAGISLLVGGIGVMNIMLVSITERTREIGTRKALGAKNSLIRLQFITEAVVLCLIGGIIGIIVGVSLGAEIANILGYSVAPPISAIIVAVVFSMAIGIFFGYYPANKAAKLNPIDALRYE